MMSTLLVIDDDEDIFHLVKSYGKDHKVDHCFTLMQAEAYLKSNSPSLILLDIELKEENGLDFYLAQHQNLHELGIPVMMLTKVENLSKKLEAFELGAVDYVIKPFQPPELMARIKLQLKKIPAKELDKKKDILFDSRSARAYLMIGDKKESLDLSPIEFKLLAFLAQHEEEIFSREMLMERVWGDDLNITDRTVDQHVSKLRKKVMSEHYFIKTVHNKGYAFCKKTK